MPHVSIEKRLIRHRTLALFLFFFIPGLLMASWAARTPAIRDTLMVSTAGMGVVLFGLSIGSMSGILCSGWLVKRFGTHHIIRSGIILMTTGMVTMSLSLFFSHSLLFAGGLAILGMGLGSSEVAMNVEGAIVEGLLKKTVLPVMHGFYSLGTLAGAGIGIGLTAINFSVHWHLLVAGLVIILPAGIAIKAIPAGVGKHQPATPASNIALKKRPFYKDIQLILIGTIVLAMAFAEGSASDWLSLLMVDGHGFSSTSSSLIYAGFTLGMTVGRFSGGWFIDRFSRVHVVRTCAFLGILGIGMIIFVDNAVIAGISVILWGLGTSLGFPLTISAAGDTGPDAATRVSVVAASGYIAFLVGPPLLGFLGEHYGLRHAMLVVLVLLFIAALIAKAVARPVHSEN